MVDNYDRKDVPGSSPGGSDPDVGASATFDLDGHLRKVEIDVQVPGAAGGSKPAHVEFGGDSAPHPGAGHPWTPDFRDPNQPVDNPLPVHEGWVRDPATGLDHPDFSGHRADDGDPGQPSSGMGDFPTPGEAETTG